MPFFKSTRISPLYFKKVPFSFYFCLFFLIFSPPTCQGRGYSPHRPSLVSATEKKSPKQGRNRLIEGVSLKTKVPGGRLTFEMSTNVSWPEFIWKKQSNIYRIVDTFARMKYWSFDTYRSGISPSNFCVGQYGRPGGEEGKRKRANEVWRNPGCRRGYQTSLSARFLQAALVAARRSWRRSGHAVILFFSRYVA